MVMITMALELKILIAVTTVLWSLIFVKCDFISTDNGGNRGYALGFMNTSQYVGSNNYLSPSLLYPKNEMTFSVYFRLMGFDQVGISGGSTLFSVVCKADVGHVKMELSSDPNLSLFVQVATSVVQWDIPEIRLEDFIHYWTRATVTYSLNNANSGEKGARLSLYLNGTLVQTALNRAGLVLRWADDGLLLLGGYSLSTTTIRNRGRFLGWLDELSFYNRVLSQQEISTTWTRVGNTSDSSLFIYYSFDEGPGSEVIRNRGSIGSIVDLHNGRVFGSKEYAESESGEQRSVFPALWVSENCPFITFDLSHFHLYKTMK